MTDQVTPEEALQRLVAGNERFRSGRSIQLDLPAQARATAGGQAPFAIVLSCIDSRVPAELIFDLGIGDIFSARVAGNVLNEDVLGSMEFACKLVGVRLIVVLGHTSCGAVNGAVAGAELGHLSGLLAKIKPAVEAARQSGDESDPGFVDNVAVANVQRVLGELHRQSPVLEDLISSGEVGLCGAMYSVQTGEVEFLDS